MVFEELILPGVVSLCCSREGDEVYKDPPEDELYADELPLTGGEVGVYEGSTLGDLFVVDVVEARSAKDVGG